MSLFHEVVNVPSFSMLCAVVSCEVFLYRSLTRHRLYVNKCFPSPSVVSLKNRRYLSWFLGPRQLHCSSSQQREPRLLVIRNRHIAALRLALGQMLKHETYYTLVELKEHQHVLVEPVMIRTYWVGTSTLEHPTVR